MTLHVLADAEQVVSTYLRSRSEISALVSDRVYTEIPAKSATFPLVRLTRVGGAPTSSMVPHLDAALIQVDAFGGTKYQARTIAATVAAALSSSEVAGTEAHSGYVTGSEVGALRYLPDETFEPAKPRYLLDVLIYLHPSTV